MAVATDESGIQFRILNGSKGPAVRATRAQADRILYKAAIRHAPGEPAQPVAVPAGRRRPVMSRRATASPAPSRSRASRSVARAVVLTAGTFLDGKIHVGLQNYSGRPRRRPAGAALSARLKELKLPQRPAQDRHAAAHRRPHDRLLAAGRAARRRHADADGITTPMPVFSFMGNAAQHPRQMPCWVTHTNARTHEIIRSGFDRSPMFTGVIEGVGPRYCPSIEDKVNRFADKDSHQIFLEPEGLTTHEFYPNGISTVAAVRHPAGRGALDGRPGKRAHPASRLRDRIRLLRPARAEEHVRDHAPSPACSSPARSTAPPATKRRRRRACSPASTPRCMPRARRRLGAAAATRPTWACWSTT